MSNEPFENSPDNTMPQRRWGRAGGSRFTRRIRPALTTQSGDTAVGLQAADYSKVPSAPDDHLALSSFERFEQHMAEINRASALLRQALPDLEAWPNQSTEAAPIVKPRPVWLVVGVLWISTLALTAMATLAIAVLVS